MMSNVNIERIEHEFEQRLREWARGWFERLKPYNEYFESILSKIINEYKNKNGTIKREDGIAIIKKELQISGMLGDRIANALLKMNCEWIGRDKGVLRGWQHIRCGDYYITLPSSINETSEREKIQKFYDEVEMQPFLIELEYHYADLISIYLLHGEMGNTKAYVRIKFDPELVIFSEIYSSKDEKLVAILSYSQDTDKAEIHDVYKEVYRDGDVIYEGWDEDMDRQAIQFVLEHMQDFDRALTMLLQIIEIGFKENNAQG
jgi:hypothetical protein